VAISFILEGRLLGQTLGALSRDKRLAWSSVPLLRNGLPLLRRSGDFVYCSG